MGDGRWFARRPDDPIVILSTPTRHTARQDIVYPTEIVGKRTRCKMDGSKTMKVFLDNKDQVRACLTSWLLRGGSYGYGCFIRSLLLCRIVSAGGGCLYTYIYIWHKSVCDRPKRCPA